MKALLIFIVLLSGINLVNAQSVNRLLYEAVQAKDTIQVERLLNNGANANYQEKVMGSFGMKMLILAVQNQDLKTVKLLIEHKADVNMRDMFKSTPLMYAAHSGNINVIKYLITQGADVRANDEQGNSVLSAAKEGKHQEAIDYISTLLK
jgi:ankyrin repeat protein